MKTGQKALVLLVFFFFPHAFCETEKVTEQLPKFYLTKIVSFCSLDSPELYKNIIAMPSLEHMLDEGKIFFGVLMDNLHDSLENSDELSDKLLEKWEYLTETILDSFDMAVERINQMWNLFIGNYETPTLPWETQAKKHVVHEVLTALGYEYLMVDVIVRSGVKEIVGTLQGYFAKLIKNLEQEMIGDDPSNEQINATMMMQKLEETIEEVEPTFIGNLLLEMIRRAKQIANQTWNASVNTFLDQTLEQTAILIDSYRNQRDLHANSFWQQMTVIMLQEENVSKIPKERLYSLYSSSHDLLIKTIFSLVSGQVRR